MPAFGRLPAGTNPSHRQVETMMHINSVTLHSVALRASRSATHLRHANRGYLATCVATSRRPLELLYRSWTRIYAAGLCRVRN
jgi:hypothetical protein